MMLNDIICSTTKISFIALGSDKDIVYVSPWNVEFAPGRKNLNSKHSLTIFINYAWQIMEWRRTFYSFAREDDLFDLSRCSTNADRLFIGLGDPNTITVDLGSVPLPQVLRKLCLTK